MFWLVFITPPPKSGSTKEWFCCSPGFLTQSFLNLNRNRVGVVSPSLSSLLQISLCESQPQNLPIVSSLAPPTVVSTSVVNPARAQPYTWVCCHVLGPGMCIAEGNVPKSESEALSLNRLNLLTKPLSLLRPLFSAALRHNKFFLFWFPDFYHPSVPVSPTVGSRDSSLRSHRALESARTSLEVGF